MKPPRLPFLAALTSSPSSGPLNRKVTLHFSPWVLGLAFLGLPRLAQAQDVTSGTAIYTTNWAGGTISSGATLRLDNGGTVSGDVTNNGTLQYNANASGNLTISNTVAGSGTLSLTGSGILTLSGANTYTGLTTVSTGVLKIQNANALGTTAAGTSLTAGAALQIQGDITTAAEALTLRGAGVSNDGALRNISGTNTYAGLVTLGEASRINSDAGTLILSNAGTITGSSLGLTVGGAGNTTIASIIGTSGGTLTKDGLGTLTLSGANTFTGASTVSAGVLNIQNANALGSAVGSTSVTSGAALQIQGNITTVAEALTLNGTGVSTDGALRNISGTNTYAGLLTLGAASRINSDAGTLTLSHTGTIMGATFGLTVGGAGNTTIASIIGTTTGTLTKDGAGTLTLNGANTFTGGTAINAGSVSLGAQADQALGTGTVVVNSGGTLITNRNALSNSLTLNGGTLQEDNGFGSNFSGAIDLATTSTVTTPYSMSFSNTASGAGGLIKNGIGEVRLSGANTYTGTTTISAGTLQIGVGGTTGSLSTSSAITNNGTLAFNRSNTITQGTDFNSVISGTGAVTKAGSGTLELTGANTFTGATTVSAGILNLRNATGLGTAAGGTTVGNGATLQLQGGISVGAEALSLNGGAASGQTGALVNVSGTNTYGGAVTVASSSSISAASGSVLNLTGGVVKNGTVATFNGGGTINVNTVAISGASANSDLVIDGTTVNVDVASTYNGPTFIRNSGTLNANVTDALPTANGRTAVTFDGTGTSVLTLGAAQSVASLTSAGAATVTLNANALTVGTSTGSTTFAGIIGGTGGLIKDGASTQTLSGANTYSGATTVSAGTLEVSGANSTSAVNINGGTLLLSGSAANRISDAAPISLGAATDSKLQLSGAVTETLGALTLAGGAGARVIDFGATSGVLTLASLSADSHLPLHIWNWSGNIGIGGGTDRLFITNGFAGSLAASDISFFSGSGTGLYSGATAFTSTGELVPVPEASTLLAVLGLIAPLAWRERRHWMRCREARGN